MGFYGWIVWALSGTWVSLRLGLLLKDKSRHIWDIIFPLFSTSSDM